MSEDPKENMNTNIENELKIIKKSTRLAMPEDDTYIFRLGVALYGFSSINSFMTEILCYIDSGQKSNEVLSNDTSGRILDKFRKSRVLIPKNNREVRNIMLETANKFEKLNTERTDIVHAYPITGSQEQQILHRRKDTKNKYFEVTNEFLDDFIQRLEEVSDGLYAIRKIIKPEFGGLND
ncbi:hypothetical protein [Lactococcus petauri]|uniref:hypothetical protein n=1 Tax=Lactococcus petauri TaxID=1940789 RepID=UPI0022E4DB4B|nr:hypothetical protein [Lactococcus petauri]